MTPLVQQYAEGTGGATGVGGGLGRRSSWHTVPVRIVVCGVRGSTPAPGGEFVRYGGHTSCLAIAHDGEVPSLVIDAGTGIRRASDMFGAAVDLFGGRPMDGTILLGHLHWDHVQGLPFFAAGNTAGSHVEVYSPVQAATEEALKGFMSPPYFPISAGELLGTWTFLGIEEGAHEIGGFSVVAREIPHSPGRTFGYRISDGGATVAYLSDHCPTELGPGRDGLGEIHDAALELALGCDVLFHDAQYTDDELPARARFGHASCGYAVALGQAANAGEVVLFHHDPGRVDDEIDAIVASYAGADIAVSAAAEGDVLDLPRRRGARRARRRA